MMMLNETKKTAPMDSYTGAYATPGLVGRHPLLAQLKKLLKPHLPGPQVIFFHGIGGIGKTRLLSETLKQAREIPGLQVANEVIDLYHDQHHTSNGLAEAIFTVLTPPTSPFSRYEIERRKLERIRLSGEVVGVTEQRERTLQFFLEDFKAILKHYTVVLALDTAERLVYGSSHPAGTTPYIAEAWAWFVRSLAGLNNVILLVAGRPQTENLNLALRESLGHDWTKVEVGPFTEQESLDYFDKVAQTASQEGDEVVARRVAKLENHTRRLAHLYAGGRPILLALLVDYLSIAGTDQLPPVLRTSIEEAGKHTKAELEEIQHRLEAQLIARIKETPRLGDTVVALGRAPKGVSDVILSRILEIPLLDAQDRLKGVRRLSFVKMRPADAHLFLHDEMYAMLGRQVYNRPEDAPEDKRVGQALGAYYDEQTKQSREELDALYAPVEREGKGQLDFNRLIETHTHRQILLTEALYYRLRQSAVRGFQRFYRYNREAILSADTILSLQLGTELQTFLAETDPDQQIIGDGLDRSLVDHLLAFRPIEMAWAERDFNKVVQRAHILRKEGALDKLFAEGLLIVWESYALTLLGEKENLKKAHEKLDGVIEQLEKGLAQQPTPLLGIPLEMWLTRASLALAYRVRAYLKRVRGFMHEALTDYRQAAVLWRQINLLVELAAVLNDMGFAMVELGYWSDARALVNEALDIRRRLGTRMPVGLGLNTLANIDFREGNYTDAMDRALKALALFRALEYRRGIGLALVALAESQRRVCGTELVPQPEEKTRRLREARDHAQEALHLFEELGEKSRQVEALIEMGCACRDWVKIRQEFPSPRDPIERLIAEGEESLRKAADLAGEGILYRRVDALVNLAFLGFYSGRDELLEEAAQAAEQAVPDAYHIQKNTGKPAISYDRAQVLLWPQLGKLQVLYGHRTANRAQTQHTGRLDQSLVEAARFYMWGLQYSVLYSEDYRDLRRVKEEIYDQMKELNLRELRAVAEMVQRTEAEYHLEESAMRQFLNRRALWYGA